MRDTPAGKLARIMYKAYMPKDDDVREKLIDLGEESWDRDIWRSTVKGIRSYHSLLQTNFTFPCNIARLRLVYQRAFRLHFDPIYGTS